MPNFTGITCNAPPAEWMILRYLSADHRDDDVLVVSAAPAQDVGSLLVAFMTQLVYGVLRTAERGDKKQKHEKWAQF